MIAAIPGFGSPHGYRPEPEFLTRDDLVVLTNMLVDDDESGRGMVYSSPGHRNPTQRHLRALDGMGLVEFIGWRAGGWDRGMWAARLTVLGKNVAYRGLAGTGPDTHVGCGGAWLPSGGCTGCRNERDLDREAYEDWLDALDPQARRREQHGPRLFCIEHGFLRQKHVRTDKTCGQPGTPLHDGGLLRL